MHLQTRHRSQLGIGLKGTGKTVATMRTLIDEGSKNPALIEVARRTTLTVPEWDQKEEAKALFEYVQRAMRYTRDPLHAETLTDIDGVLSQINAQGRSTGDCDEHVIFLGALLQAIGIPVEPVVESYAKSKAPTHVALRARIGDEWIHLDPTVKDRPFGSKAGMPTRSFSESEITMNSTSALSQALGLPPGLGEGGVTMAQTGKSSNEAWGEFFGGLRSFGDWAFKSPFVEQWVIDQQIDNAEDLAKMSNKYGYDMFERLYGPGPSADYWRDKSPSFEVAIEEKDKKWLIIGLGAVAAGAVTALFLSRSGT